MLYANFTTLSFIEPELLPIEVLHCGNKEFRVFFCEKWLQLLPIICSHPETHFMTYYRLFYLVYSRSYAHSKCFFSRGNGGRGHFQSPDKDGGHTIRSAIAKKLLLYADFTTLSFIEPELLPIEVLHCWNREFRVFLRKIVEIIIFLFATRRDVAVDEAHFM